MEKNKIVKLVDLIAGGLSIVAGIFAFVLCIICFTNFSDYAKGNWWLIINIVLDLASCGGFVFFGIMAMLPFLKGKEDSKSLTFAIGTYFAFETLIGFFSLCFWGFSASAFLNLLFGLIGLALGIVGLFAKFEKMINLVINGGFLLIGFVLSIIDLCYSSGVNIAFYIFIMLTILAYATSMILKLVFDNNSSSSSSSSSETESK